MAASEKNIREKDRKQRPTNKLSDDKLKKGQVGESLRSIYQQTVDEQVPDEFLDILGKLA
ncbi:MAG: NepR family anti-sigma factor [Sphingomonadaceae bacterium]